LIVAARGDGQRAWVTGATSFLGRHVARRLSAEGFAVIGFSRRAVPADLTSTWGFEAVETGELSGDLLRQARERSGAPAVAFHAIGSGSVGEAAADPAADFLRTFRSAEVLVGALCRLAPAARLIYPSSAAVYGAVPRGPISEDAATGPVSDYGRNKLFTEEMCRDWARRAGLDVVIARFFSVYGPPQRKLLLWELGQRLLSGDKVVRLGGSGEETRDFIYVTDATAIVATLACAPAVPKVLNVGTGRATSIRTIATKFAAVLKVNAEIVFTGASRAGDPLHQQADVSRLATIASIASRSLEDGLAEYALWLRGTVAGDVAAAVP
jgi:UDP-glucose 4-epimerase